ncbi:MAG TPA: CcmD family protein [Gaiellaceae bacterium]
MILALTSAEKYVGAAYGVLFVAVLVYVLIIALKLVRLERELGELTERLRAQPAQAEPRREVPVG